MQPFIQMLRNAAPWGLTIVRIAMGALILRSGINKIFILGFEKLPGIMEHFGIPLAQVTGPFIGLLELAGGAALLLGFFSRYLSVLFCIEFIVAGWSHWLYLGEGFMGARLELLLAVCGFLLATNGGGPLSLDKTLKRWDA